ncbi:hypothetical protein CWI42_041290 [Ordospora colligata]|uniref:Uncharacterized protein n=1 Tax=Ordospora colligata OC4 TaxID=1354746 RepID=A0A0B2UKN7_9MICR|nr:uncharacterized protein M896_041300 [Ordospora colligata OC4]KHN69933.1 hypothetical protein M896_041300 [Ordospora colligata OC4]TBU16103.1 hypothetical protein CWI41_041290 [Ordospora colligata]TBU16316.1 hypothetical protein CWI40_041290 [Ordospora colligata]TBU19020.1 hypothetical protein CWI42_041290 [Ordospora colligata]
MTLMLPEQEDMMGHFADPVSFINAYTHVYEKQKGVPVKIGLQDILYYEWFEQALLEMVLERVFSKDGGEPRVVEAEDALESFRQHRFFDEEFYNVATLVIIKGVAMLLDRIDQEVCQRSFVNVRYLYFYTIMPVDLTRILIEPCLECIEQPKVLMQTMLEVKKSVEDVNMQLNEVDVSFLADDARLSCRINLSDVLLGPARIKHYSLNNIYGSVFDLVLVRAAGMTSENAYLYVMEVYSEYITFEIGPEELVECLKEYLNKLMTGY